ncbi:MAG: hypothetical protein IJG81_07740 [Muribaculaceae bacterium]|nr:hypothetical protein [Muribaculaceae bacterium]
MLLALVGACATTADAKRRVHRKAKPKAKTTATVTTTGRAQGHDYVDLGLPSGTLWATMNVGANSPEDYGYYFAWGEIAPKSVYDWSTYKWNNGDYDQWTKYCTDNFGYNGFVDNKSELDPADDAATANWGSGWRMPSIKQMEELYENCTSEWTAINGVNGRLFKSKKNGASLFLPAAGGRWVDELDDLGADGGYWLRKLNSGYPSNAYYLGFCSDYYEFWDLDGWSRYGGLSVRAVRVSKN